VSRKPRLLIVEDEAAIRAGLADVFVYHGYEVELAVDGVQGMAAALAGRHELVLLDVMMPGHSGFEILEAVRAQDRDLPVILLTARTADEDVIQGLALGADDYVAKPFSVAQLVLRVQAVLRRTRAVQDELRTIRLDGGIEIDTAHLSARVQGQDVHFTRREMDILQYLAAHDDRPVPREELLHKVWGYARQLGIETRTVDIHLAKLRRKLESDPRQPQHLLTVRGGGYKLVRAR